MMIKSKLFFAVIALATVVSFQNCTGFQTASVTSPSQSTSAANLPPTNLPAAVANNDTQPAPATSGVPKVHHLRGGIEIETFNTLGDAFTRTHAYRNYETGDVYELDAAVYVGQQNQPWIGPLPKDDADYTRGAAQWLVPKNLVIRGRTQNGVRPVVRVDSAGLSYNTLGQGAIYIDQSVNLTIENIDFDGGGPSAPASGKAGIYINGAQGFTLRNSRVLNFNNANGVFSTGSNSGLITFENVETGFNGGDSGPEHNYYMGESATDPNHTILWRGCYSHDVYYGHTLKSRAQNNIVEATHLKGKKATTEQGEAFLADFPNGGNVTMKNNILEKDASGDNSNGIFIGYAMEGQHYPNASSITIVHNTFVAHALYYDSQNHPLFPMNFFYPGVAPSDPAFPVKSVVVKANAFAGFLVDPSIMGANMLYRGDDAKIYPLTNFDANLISAAKDVSSVSSIGELQHAGVVGSKLRTTSVYGGLD